MWPRWRSEVCVVGAVDWGREEGWEEEAGREAWVQAEVSVERLLVLSARRREMLRPLRKDEADWRDLASWWMLEFEGTVCV